MNHNFSVLMSLYINEKAEYVRECFESLLRQTVLATEWVIVEDGPLHEDVYKLLDEYQTKYPNLIKRVSFKENRGLGLALREGVLNCTYDLIARMDTDDIAREDRFELQLKEFDNNPGLDICGSHIKEFEGNKDNVVSLRKVPLTQLDIYKYQKRRSSFNHMTVMFKRNGVLKAGNYEHCPLMEDDMLWCRMFIDNCIAMNIDDYLVFARVGYNMIKRRGGYSYFLKYKEARKRIMKTNYISKFDYLYTIAVQVVVCLLPNFIRKIIFEKVLRKV